MVRKKNVFAIIVTYNGMKWLDRCIGSLEVLETPVHIVVIDNASTDGTPDYIAEHFPNVHLIRSEINHGFAKANNIGIRYALDNGADYFFLLNQDAWTESNTINKLREVVEDDNEIGIVSPVHFNGRGDALDWGFCSNMPSDFISDSFLCRLKGRYYCEFINAAGWLVTRECIEKVGGFDTLMFVHYGEDGNYCHRVKFHGFKIAVCTSVKIYHDREFRRAFEKEYRSQHFKQEDLNKRVEFTNILYDIDIDSFIVANKISIRKSYLKLNFRQAKRIKRENEFLNAVKISRETNIRGGLNWL